VLVRKLALAASCTIALLLASCSLNSAATKDVEASKMSSVITSSQTSQIDQSTQPDFHASIIQEASLYKSTPGRVALSMLICRLDSSYVYSDLVKKNANELFDIVSKTAFKNNITLESLNTLYGLCDILESEKIYVSIESNNVTSLPQPSVSSSTTSDATRSIVSDTSSKAVSSQTTDSEASTSSSINAAPWITKFQKAILESPVK
jgi:hypothetical protein